MKLTKIICTIGPASNNEEVIRSLRAAGMDVVRLNFSHGDHAQHTKTFEMIRSIEESIPIAIDISGPKIRVKDLPEPIKLNTGEKTILTIKNTVDIEKKILPVNYPKLTDEVSKGSRIFIDDGLIELRVDEIIGDDVYCTVVDGGIVTSRKGINVPGSKISLHVPTKKDVRDIEKACDLEADFLFVSFVRETNDLKIVKEIIASKTDHQMPIISKIEHIDAIRNINAIVQESDGLMVARGDLAIEVGPEKVPVLQRQLIDLGISFAKPVIVATQMLESMRYEPIPTRAEASDVAHAVFDHADALMLSAETASGNFPVEAVRTMKNIILEAEKMLRSRPYTPKNEVYSENKEKNTIYEKIASVLASSATEIAAKIHSKAIVALTLRGFSARVLSKNRFPLPILAVTPNKDTYKRLQLFWGIHPVLHEHSSDFNQLIYDVMSKLYNKGFIGSDDNIVMVHGSFLGIPGKTNTIQVLNVSEILAGRH